ncbi:MAG: hypothetical protein A2984_01910 [Omnitrophica WOR_2 bacterium RIFCSPLOWO2_01_FULL_41_12]|nr:MAG: hypothetical protein A2984_01910 [Omnitrophica WOR_2 bacterium RIFCSPLOWO2_01_FULL_41_12]
MKKLIIMGLIAVCFLTPALAEEQTKEKPKEFAVYIDKNSRENHYIPSGWMGDYGDIKLNDSSMDNPHSGTTSMQFVFSGKKSQGKGWAGVYWQNPAQNWGSKKGGFDLTGMTKLTFFGRGAKGDEVIQKFKVGGIGIEPKATYPDSAEIEMGPIELTDTWKEYSINLAGKDLSYINGGFCWVTTSDLNPEGATFYLDDIKFVADPLVKPEGKKQRGMPFYVYADSRSAGNHFIPSGWMPDAGTAKDLKYDGVNKEDPYLGDTCIKIAYNDVSGNRWAGIYWQNPPNNWGSIDAGFDLSKATKLTFWARGAKGGERIEEFKVGGIMGEFSDSDSAGIGPVLLNKEWTQYSIDLKGKDMSYISGGFCWATNIDVNPDGATFYLDEIKYE